MAEILSPRSQPGVFARRPRHIWRDALARLLHDPRGVFGLAVVIVFTLIAILGPELAPHDPRRLDYGNFYTPPLWMKQSITGAGPSATHPLGTDGQGRDVLSRALYGTRTSMIVGWATTLLTLLIGLPVGLVAGYRGGKVDDALMRITDVFYALPTIMFYIVIVLMLRDTPVGGAMNGLLMLVVAFATVGWVGIARLTRGATLVLRHAPFVDAAYAAGAPSRRVIISHILPNIVGTVLVWAAGAVPSIITAEAILGYLRIGLSPPTDPDKFFTLSWGGLFLEGRMALHGAPWVFGVPAVCLALLTIGFTFLGDSLRDTLDPRTRAE